MNAADMPPNFDHLWRVGGWHDEHEHAQRVCRVLGYERDPQGRDVCRVRFVGQADLFSGGEAMLSPHMLFPASTA
jgi:hypothetical protein